MNKLHVQLIFLVFVLILIIHGDAFGDAVIKDINLAFQTVDPLTGKTGIKKPNPRIPVGMPGAGNPRPLWVPSGTTVRMWVEVIFDRGLSQTVPVLSDLYFSAAIWDHDDGFIIPGIDDPITSPKITYVPDYNPNSPDPKKKAGIETYEVGPFDFTVTRSDTAKYKQVFSNPPGAIIESGDWLEDYEYENQSQAETLEIFAPYVLVKDWDTDAQFAIGASARFYLSVLLENEPPPPGALRIPPIPEPSTLLLLGSGLAGLVGFGRKKLFKKEGVRNFIRI